jgi:hypothetical protein
MTVIEIVHTHPFAAGIAVGILLAYGSLVLCTAFLFTLEKNKVIARRTVKSDAENPRTGIPSRQFFSEPSVGSPDSSSIT